MRKALLTLVFLAAVPAAMATSVTYSTTGELCLGASGCGFTSIVDNQGGGNILTLAFTPQPGNSVDPGGPGFFTFGSLGSLDLTCVGTCNTFSLAGYNLYLTITQTSPTAGSQAMVAGALSGGISGTQSTAMVTWSNPNQVIIDNFGYSIANNPLAIVAPTSGQGVTSIQGRIDELAIPEPSTYLLLSAGLLGLGIRRKFAKR